MDISRFQMLDRALSVSLSEQTILCGVDVPKEHSVFEGHFPGFPVLPGVLQAEVMAQTAGLLVFLCNRGQLVPLLSGYDDLRFRRFVAPGSSLLAEAHTVHTGSGYAVASVALRDEEGAVANGQVRFRLMGFPSAEMRQAVEASAERLLETVPA